MPLLKKRAYITFHGTGPAPRGLDAGEAAVWASEDLLCAVLDSLAGRPDIGITFDDGNRSDVDVAVPQLVARGLKATFFVCAGRLGDERYLGHADLTTLLRAGMGVGSHGMAHRSWRGLDDGELDVEVAEARRRLEEAAGVSVREAALPFGAYDRRALSRARRAGFHRVFTSDTGRASSTAWLVPRTTVNADDGPVALLRRADARSAVLVAKRIVKALR